MPIKPENRKRYPRNMKAIRDKVLKREGHRCRLCFVGNYWIGYRTGSGKFRPSPDQVAATKYYELADADRRQMSGERLIRIVLTIAHLDQQPENNHLSNLAALCQRCHNIIDAPHRRRNAKATRDAASGRPGGDLPGQARIFEEDAKAS